MSDTERLKYLSYALRAVALIFVLGVYPLTVVWPAGWAWHFSGQSEYLQMIIAIYFTLGVFVWLAARDPERHLSLISFVIWSSVVHGGVMAVQSLVHSQHFGHLYGDVPALLIVAAVLGWLCPRALKFQFGGKAA